MSEDKVFKDCKYTEKQMRMYCDHNGFIVSLFKWMDETQLKETDSKKELEKQNEMLKKFALGAMSAFSGSSIAMGDDKNLRALSEYMGFRALYDIIRDEDKIIIKVDGKEFDLKEKIEEIVRAGELAKHVSDLLANIIKESKKNDGN